MNVREGQFARVTRAPLVAGCNPQAVQAWRRSPSPQVMNLTYLIDIHLNISNHLSSDPSSRAPDNRLKWLANP